MKQLRTTLFVIGIGILVFTLLAVFWSLQGFALFDGAFGPNLQSALVGGALGGAISLTVVLISFTLQLISRSRALEPARFLFLRNDCEKLKESYLAFINTLGISNQSTLLLSGKSWNALDKSIWPDVKSIDTVQNKVSQSKISNPISSQGVLTSYDLLQKSVDAVVHASATAIFEGKENIIEGVLWRADYNVRKIWPELNLLIGSQASVNLSSIEQPLKDASMSVGMLLRNFCKLADSIKLK